MLIIQRHVGESIVLSNGVEITVGAVTKRGVRLAVRAPNGIAVLRGEVYDAIVEANAAAAGTPFESAPLETLNAERK
jgi:carbon storage regulator